MHMYIYVLFKKFSTYSVINLVILFSHPVQRSVDGSVGRPRLCQTVETGPWTACNSIAKIIAWTRYVGAYILCVAAERCPISVARQHCSRLHLKPSSVRYQSSTSYAEQNITGQGY